MSNFQDFGPDNDNLMDVQQSLDTYAEAVDNTRYSLSQAAKELGITRSGMHWLLVNRDLIGECETVKRLNGKNLLILIPAKTLEKLKEIRKD